MRRRANFPPNNSEIFGIHSLVIDTSFATMGFPPTHHLGALVQPTDHDINIEKANFDTKFEELFSAVEYSKSLRRAGKEKGPIAS